jgi:integrase
MASLHKVPRRKSPFWYCAFALPNGRRAFRSTKQTDKKKAWDVARALEKASDEARAGELTEVTVRKLFDDLLAGIGSKPLHSDTVREFFSSWLSGKELSVKTGTFRLYAKAVQRFVEFLGTRADKALSGITPREITAFRNHRHKAGGVAIGTLNLDLSVIRSVFSLARRQGLLLHSPAEAVELPANRPQQRSVFSSEEIRALLSVASPEWRILILAGYFAGIRLSDAAALRWDNVDLELGQITYKQTKTGGTVRIPIHPDLAAQLLALAGSDNPHAYVCPTLAKTRTGGKAGLSNQFKGLMAQAGIDPEIVKTARNHFSRKSFHSLRHSFASALANAGIGADVRMKLVGHRSVEAHQRYTHFELETFRAAIAALPPLQ